MICFITLTMLLAYVPMYTCEKNDTFIQEGQMVFIGGDLVGRIEILKSAVYKRGNIKLRCSSECLRRVDCSGIRIDFNTSICSILKGQLSALEQPLSSCQIFMKTGTTNTIQMSSITENSPQTISVTGNLITTSTATADETASITFATGIATTENRNEIVSPNTVTKTALQDRVTDITSRETVNKTISLDTITDTTSSDNATETTSQKSVADTIIPDSVSKTASPETANETTSADIVIETTSPDTMNENTSPNSGTDTTKTVNEISSSTEIGTTFLDTTSTSTSMGIPSTTVSLLTSTKNTVCSDCECIGTTTSLSGVYEITVDGGLTSVYCEFAYGFDWTVVFRRTVGNVLFNNVWTSYTNGFGNLEGDFWLGLDYIHRFTSSGQSVMRTEMEDINGTTGFAQYSTFLVGSPSSDYKLTVSQYAGNSGYDAFLYHNNMKFSTKDRDNDLSSSINCAGYYGEPWWNNDCSRMKFTRNNFNDLGWYNWYTGSYKQLSKIRMMIRKPSIVDTSGCSDCDCVGSLTGESGVYEVIVDGNPLQVFCEMNDGYNWMVILRRLKGDVPFNNIWTSYEDGFGNLEGDFWQGLKYISTFSAAGWSVMRVEMEDIVGYYGYAQYGTFQVGDAASGYRLTISGYSGTAGYDAFSYHNGLKFSTKDVDNDLSSMNCALEYGSPWWNNDCGRVRFTLNDFKDLGWYNWYSGSYRPLVRVKMAIRK